MKFKPIFLFLFLSSACSAHEPCSQIKVAIVDTGLDLNDPRFQGNLCDFGHKDFTGEGIEDKIGHGTFVAGLIKNHIKKANYCFMILKYYSRIATSHMTIENEVMALRYAVENGATIVNLSGGGETFVEEESLIIKSHPEVLFSVAAGNENKNLDMKGNYFYPASLTYKNIFVAGSIDSDHEKSIRSNYGKMVYWEVGENVKSFLPNGEEGYMSGTSMSTAILSAKIVDILSKTCKDRGIDGN
jgi:thermitase